MRFFVRLLLLAALPRYFFGGVGPRLEADQGRRVRDPVRGRRRRRPDGARDPQGDHRGEAGAGAGRAGQQARRRRRGGHRLHERGAQGGSAHAGADQRQHPDHAAHHPRGQDADRSAAGDERDARRLRLFREGRRAVENRRGIRQGREIQAGEDLQLLHRRHHGRDGGNRAVEVDRHPAQHDQLQQRRRGAHRAARRPCARHPRQPAGIHGPPPEGRGARHRRVPRQPFRSAAERAHHEGAGHQRAQLPDVARRRRAEGRAGRRGAGTGKA